MLRDFLDKDMIEQITLLEEIRTSGRTEALPGLMDLYATPHADQAVDESVYHTLFALLAADGAVVEGLRHPSERVRMVAVRRAGEDRVPAALAILRQRLVEDLPAEALAATIKAVGQFTDPGLGDVIIPFIDHADDMVAVAAMQALARLKGEAGRQELRALADRWAAGGANGGSLKLAEAIRLVSGKEE